MWFPPRLARRDLESSETGDREARLRDTSSVEDTDSLWLWLTGAAAAAAASTATLATFILELEPAVAVEAE